MANVLHVSNTDIHRDSRIRKEIRAISEMPGIEVAVVGIPETGEDGDLMLEGARYLRLRLFSRALRVLPRAGRYLLELIEFTFKAVAAGRRFKADVVHCHDTFALPTGWLLKTWSGCRLVYDAHELESDKNAQTTLLSWATLRIEKLCWKQIDLLVSVSESILGWYSRNLGSKPQLLVLNSPAISADPDSTAGTVRGSYFHRKYGIPGGHRVFIYLGIFSPGRGIEISLDAFAQGHPEAHVVFMGFGQLETAIRTYSSRYANIHLHEAVPHDQVVSLVRSADYGLCLVERTSLSDYYCLPNKLFEYCFARVPVLASNFPEIERLVETYSLGMCCSPDSASVRAAIRQLSGRRCEAPTSDVTALSWQVQAARLTTAYRERLLAPWTLDQAPAS